MIFSPGKQTAVTVDMKKRGHAIALMNDLPHLTGELPPDKHSFEMRFIVRRFNGYRRIYDSIDTMRLVRQEKILLEKRCRELGIRPVFADDHVSLENFPWNSAVKEEIVSCNYCIDGKILEKKTWFDVIEYYALQ